MNEMIERVALALKAKIGEAFNAKPIPHSPPEWGAWSATGGSLNLEELARAAIEAMREPTEEMIEAAYYPAGEPGDQSVSRSEAEETWHAMIDAALKESEPTSQI